MKALCWYGKHDVRVVQVPDPHIINPRDAIIKVTSTAICGSDLHLYDGYMPRMERGDILGHEFMGEVMEVGPGITNLKVGDRVVVPFAISCGNCFYCQKGMSSLCDNSNPTSSMAEKLYGYSGAGLFGYSHIFGGYAGGQAEYVRVPFADVGPLKLPDGIPDEMVLFLSDILPTGYMAAENCQIEVGDTVAVWGCGPVGLFAIKSAILLGAEKVIAIDHIPERLKLAKQFGAYETLNYETTDVIDELHKLTAGSGPDRCIDAVGLEAHGKTPSSLYDRAKAAISLESDRPIVLKQAIQACRKGGTLSIPGVYGGFIDKFNLGAAFAKGLTFKMGQTHVPKYMKLLLDLIVSGKIDPSKIISHRLSLDEGPKGYAIFKDKSDHCTKIVMHPHGSNKPLARFQPGTSTLH